MPLTPGSPGMLGSVEGGPSLAISNSLPDLCSIYQQSKSPDGQSGWEISYELAAEEVRCQIEKVTTIRKAEMHGKEIIFTEVKAEFALGAPITAKARVRANGLDWDVVSHDAGITSPLMITAKLSRQGT